jgi:hypothetical protein
MYGEKYFAIVVNGAEKYFRTSRHEATRKAAALRRDHGTYSVWLRPHFRLVSKQGDIVSL